MATPKQGYWLDGERLPSVTTVLSRFKESGALMHWAWEQGKAGKDYREERDKAAGIGTIAHEMVEAHIRGHEFDASQYAAELVEKAKKPFAAFLEWAGSTQLKPLETEVALISNEYRFGGTLDAMLIRDNLALGDWKTSNGVYGDYLMQLAAYAQLWKENRPDRPITGGFHLLRFDKEYGDFHHHWYSDLDDAWEMFKHLRAAYSFDKKLKKRAA
jgi:hypothetical protein